MNEKLPNPRPRTTKLIEDMLAQRKKMLVLFWELSRLRQADAEDTADEMLEEFLEVLVDYIAAGHFGLYQRIVEGTERRQPVIETARQIYPKIASTTDLAVRFSEKYEEVPEPLRDEGFARDLSSLGEHLTTRIELEDSLIMAMLGKEFPIPAVN